MITAPSDTIAAIATPPGRGGVGIVRISGSAACSIVAALLEPPLNPRFAHYRRFHAADGSVIDEGLALYFPAPRSFTGEDVVELHAHGGPVVLDLLLRRVLSLGARVAKPGEFTERAFLNDKIDLAQAEAVADLIDSATEQAARSAQRSLQGEFSRHIHDLVDGLVNLRTYIEAAIDFSDEEIDFLSEGAVDAKLADLSASLDRIAAAAKQGALLREGMTVVIAGRPNVGKSSLLNRLAARETAIVTDTPGTTRDILREHIHIAGMPLHIIDTAGLRVSEDAVEQEGVRRAREAIVNADRVLLVVDDRYPDEGKEVLSGLPAGLRVTRIHNKIDLQSKAPALERSGGGGTIVYLSAKTGAGMELLLDHLKDCVGYDSEVSSAFLARRRHLEALACAQIALARAAAQVASGSVELLAEDLRHAQVALGEITGEVTTEDLLGRIFSSFCIGK